MGRARIIAKQGNSPVVLSLNWYDMTQIVYVSHFHQSQYFILRQFLVLKLVDLKNTEISEIFYTLSFEELDKFPGNLIFQL